MVTKSTYWPGNLQLLLSRTALGQSLKIYKNFSSTAGVVVQSPAMRAMLKASAKSAKLVGSGARIAGPLVKYLTAIAFGYQLATEGPTAATDTILHLTFGIDRDMALAVLDGDLEISFAGPARWIVSSSVDFVEFSDQTKLHVGEPIVWFGRREDGSTYRHDGIVTKIRTLPLVAGPGGTSIARADLTFDSGGHGFDNVVLRNITSITNIPRIQDFP